MASSWCRSSKPASCKLVAYSFKARFVEPIRAGTKGGTIRKPRSSAGNIRGYGRTMHRVELVGGHAFPGEKMQLYCQQRASGGFFIAEKRCLAVEQIRLDFVSGQFLLMGRVDGAKVPVLRAIEGDRLDDFARFDGFADFAEMADFWKQTHAESVFEGWHVRWLPLPF